MSSTCTVHTTVIPVIRELEKVEKEREIERGRVKRERKHVVFIFNLNSLQ